MKNVRTEDAWADLFIAFMEQIPSDFKTIMQRQDEVMIATMPSNVLTMVYNSMVRANNLDETCGGLCEAGMLGCIAKGDIFKYKGVLLLPGYTNEFVLFIPRFDSFVYRKKTTPLPLPPVITPKKPISDF